MPPSPAVSAPGRSAAETAEARLLSTSRLKRRLMVFMVGQLLSLSVLSLATVNRIFARVTPALRADLETKARRAARELAHAADLSLAEGDPVGIYKSFGELQQ